MSRPPRSVSYRSRLAAKAPYIHPPALMPGIRRSRFMIKKAAPPS
jgi:hypothetical protein